MPKHVAVFWKELRFRWLLFACGFLVVFAIAFFALSKAAGGYRSQAWILLDSTPIAAPLVPGWSVGQQSADLEIAERQLLSPTTLLSVARRQGLYNGLSDAETVAAMRNTITTRRLYGAGRAHMLQIDVRGTTPDSAYQVTLELISELTTGASARQLAKVTAAEAHLVQEVDKWRGRIGAFDESLANLRAERIGSLPETLETRIALVSEVEDAIRITKREVALVKLGAAASPSSLSPNDYNVTQAEKVFLQLNRARSELERVRPLLEPGSQRLDLLEGRIEVFKTRLAQLSQDDQLTGVAGVISVLSNQEAELTSKLSALENSIVQTPRTLSEIEALLRERKVASAKFIEAETALASLRTWRAALSSQLAARWRVIEHPVRPTRKEGPSTAQKALIAHFLALVGAAVLVLLRSAGDPRIRDGSPLKSVFHTDPLAVFPAVPRLEPTRSTPVRGAA